jgi:hypothetical protein
VELTSPDNSTLDNQHVIQNTISNENNLFHGNDIEISSIQNQKRKRHNNNLKFEDIKDLNNLTQQVYDTTFQKQKDEKNDSKFNKKGKIEIVLNIFSNLDKNDEIFEIENTSTSKKRKRLYTKTSLQENDEKTKGKKYNTRYREQNPDAIQKYEKQYLESHKEKCKQKNKNYYQEIIKNYRSEHADKIEEKYNERHAEKMKERYKKYKERNLEKVKIYDKKYRKTHADKIKE